MKDTTSIVEILSGVNKNTIEKGRKLILSIIGLIFTIILLFNGFYTVKTGEVGIVKTFSEVKKFTDSGLHFKIPFVQSVEKMSVRDYAWVFKENAIITHSNGDKTQENTSINVSTKDMQSINIDMVVQANITDPVLLYSKFNNKHYETFILPRVQENVQAVSSKYTIEEMITKRPEYANEIAELIKKEFATVGMNVSEVSVTNIAFTPEYRAIMEQKKIATEAVEKAKKEQEKLQVEIEATQKRALIEAEAKVKIAEQNFKQKEIEAKANEVESKSLSDIIIKKRFLEKWNGELPKAMGAGTNLYMPIENPNSKQ